MNTAYNDRVGLNPRFIALQKSRSAFAVLLTIAMLLIYYAFTFAVAFFPSALATPIGEGMVTTIGFPIGILVILSAIVLTGLYVYRANTYYDRITSEILKESK